MLTVTLLGTPALTLEQRPLEVLRRKNRALLYYLAAHAEPLTRDQIVIAFWPDHERAAAQRILRTMLSELRKAVGPSLLTDDARLVLAPDSVVDARRFEAGLAARGASVAALTAALELYRGDFLDGFTLADSPQFDDWVAARREHYRLLTIRGLCTLAQLQEAQHDYAAALSSLKRALGFNPLQEDLQRACLRLHYLCGDRAGAIRRYELLLRLLDDELGVLPMPETRALYDAIIADSPSTGTWPSPFGVADHASAQYRRGGLSPQGPKGIAANKAVHNPEGVVPGSNALPFTGRAVELETLKRLSGAAKLIIVEGEPGIGKTRLVEEFIAGAASSVPGSTGEPALITRAVAHELEQGLPYQPVMDALRGLLSAPDWPGVRASIDLAPVWLAEVARLIPEIQTDLPGPLPASPLADESRLWEAVSQFLQRVSRHRRLVLFLDDLQWADASTVSLLGYLVRHIASPAMLFVGTIRPAGTARPAFLAGATAPSADFAEGTATSTPGHNPEGVVPAAAHSRLLLLMQALTREERLVRIVLGPLTASDTGTLAGKLSPVNPAALSYWLSRSAEGNPFFLTELVRYAFTNGLLGRDGVLDQKALVSTVVLPQSIQNLIHSRLTHLSQPARSVLELAVVIGQEFDFEILAHSSTLSESAMLDALDELMAAAFIQPRDGERFAFDHHLTMEVIARGLSEMRKRMLHRHVAETLERLRLPAAESAAGLIAYHLDKGGAPERATPFAVRAGRHATSLGAWAEAIAFYEQALRAEADDAQRAKVFIALGAAHYHSGDFVRGADAFRAGIPLALARADLPSAETGYWLLVQCLVPHAHYAEAVTLAQELLRDGPRELTPCAEFCWGLALSLEGAQLGEAERHLLAAERLLAAQTNFRSQITLAMLKYQRAGVLGQQGRFAQAIALYWEALSLARIDEGALDLQRHILLYNSLAYYLHLSGDPTAAEYARAGLKFARDKGTLTHQPYLLSTSGEIALAQADLTAAESLFNEGLRLAEQLDIPQGVTGLKANLGRVARQRGQTALALAYLTDALARADQIPAHHLAVRIRIWLAPLLPPQEARQRLAEAREIAERSGYYGLLDELDQIGHPSHDLSA